MHLLATLRGKAGEDVVTTIELHCAKDFDKVGAAAASWARRKAKSMPVYGSAKTFHHELRMEWIDPTPPRSSLPANAVRLPVAGSAVADGRGAGVRARKAPLRRTHKKARK